MPTRIRTELIGSRLAVLTSGQQPRPMPLGSDGTRARVALVATGSLLHPGDHVRIEVEVGLGTTLEIVEPSGTVAYSGGESTWDVRIVIRDKGNLIWRAEPFVVAAGAEVHRSTTVDLGRGAGLRLHETLVLGRTGEAAGRVLARTRVSDPDGPVLVEDLDLGPAAQVCGVLGPNRVVDSMLALGPDVPAVPGAMRLERGGILVRDLVGHAHLSRTSAAATLSTLRTY